MQARDILILLNEGNFPPPPAAPKGESTFAERKAAQLREEREAQAPQAPAEPETAQPTPPVQLESVQGDGYPELHDSEAQPELEGDVPDLEETPGEFDPIDDGGEPTVDWEKRYKDTQAKLTSVTEDRKDRDAEYADMMAGSLQLQYDMEDNLKKAKQYTGFYVDGIQGQIHNMERAFNSGQIGPEDMQAARQQYQQLQGQQQQLQARLTQIETTEREATQVKKRRQAEITRVRLQRTIPGWGQAKFREMQAEAATRGYSAEEFAEQTDHRFFEMLHDSIQLRSAGDAIGEITQRKRPKPPRGRRNAQTPRNSRGQYEKAQRDFHDNPNQKGRFADMKAKQLARERRGH